MFSDFFEVPSEWKAALKAELERDPPVLGKATLGGMQAFIPLESLASGGSIGDSGVSIQTNMIAFGPGLGDLSIQRWVNATQLAISASLVYLGPNQNALFGWPGFVGYFDIRADYVRMGAGADVVWHRSSAEQLDLVYHRLALIKNTAANETPLQVNVGGSLFAVHVGPNDSFGAGSGRALYVDNI